MCEPGLASLVRSRSRFLVFFYFWMHPWNVSLSQNLQQTNVQCRQSGAANQPDRELQLARSHAASIGPIYLIISCEYRVDLIKIAALLRRWSFFIDVSVDDECVLPAVLWETWFDRIPLRWMKPQKWLIICYFCKRVPYGGGSQCHHSELAVGSLQMFT